MGASATGSREPIGPGALAIIARGNKFNTNGTSAFVPIPDTIKGVAPNRIRLACTESVWAKLGLPLDAVVVDSAAGAGYTTGDVLTVSGGTKSAPMVLEVATAKLVSVVGDALGSGYDVGDVITLAGGTAGTKATVTLSHLQLASATLNAPGTGYAAGQVITTASAGSTAGTHATMTVASTKLVSVALNAKGQDYLKDDVLTLVGGTGTGATVTVDSLEVKSAALDAPGSGYADDGTITLAGGTSSVKAVASITATQLVSVDANAAGSGYDVGNVITTAGCTASVHPTITVDGVKAVSATVATSGTGDSGKSYSPGEVLTLVGGTGPAATFTITEVLVRTGGIVDQGTTTWVDGDTLTFSTGFATPAVITVTAVAGAITGFSYTDRGVWDTGAVSVLAITPDSTSNVAGVGGATAYLGFGVKTVTSLAAGGYTVKPTNPVATTTDSAYGLGAELTVSCGVATYSITNSGTVTVQSAALTQNGATVPAGGTGATFQNGLFGVKTFTLAPGTYTVGADAFTQDSATGGGSGATFNTGVMQIKAVSLTTPGSYTVNGTTYTVTGGAGTGATLNTPVHGVDTFTVTNRGDYTVKGTNITQNGATAPAGGTGFTASAPLWGPKTWTYSEAGVYSVTSATLTQFDVAPAGGTGATFKTASYGVVTVNVTDPGAYTVNPSNPVATTGAGTGATFTVTWSTAAVAGDILVTPYEAVVLDAVGFDYVAAIQVASAGILCVSPIEN